MKKVNLIYCLLGIIIGYGTTLYLALTKEYVLSGVFMIIGTLFSLRLLGRIKDSQENKNQSISKMLTLSSNRRKTGSLDEEDLEGEK